MPRQDKVEKVQELAERFRSTSGAMFTEYRGLTVKDAMEVRAALRDADAVFAVVKNTLTKLLLDGPMAFTFISGDPVRGAKAVIDLTRRFPALVVKGALIDGRVFGEQDARSLGSIDTREVSLGKVAGMLQAPIARTVFLLRAPLQRIAYALAERGRQGGTEADGSEE